MKLIDVLLPGFVALVSAVITGMTIRELPPSRNRGLWAGLALVLLAVSTAAVSAASGGLLPQTASIVSKPAAEFLIRIVLFTGIAATIRLCCALTIWPALFCAVACFTMVIFMEGLESAIGLISSLVAQAGLMGDPANATARMAIAGIAAAVLYRKLFLARIDGRHLEAIERTEMLFMTAVDLLVCVGYDFVTASTIPFEPPTPPALPVSVKLALCAFCVLVVFAEYETLYRRHLAEDNLVMEHLLAEKGRQYELSKQSIEAINQRAHDLLHEFWQASAEGGAREEDYARLIDELNIFDASIETGNQALDVALTEKNLICKHSGIRLSCVADGRAVEHLSPADIYALFSSVLEDAIASVQRIANPQARSIDVHVRMHGDLAAIHVGSSRQREGEEQSMPLKAAQRMVEHYSGTASCTSDTESFQFNALIPIP